MKCEPHAEKCPLIAVAAPKIGEGRASARLGRWRFVGESSSVGAARRAGAAWQTPILVCHRVQYRMPVQNVQSATIERLNSTAVRRYVSCKNALSTEKEIELGTTACESLSNGTTDCLNASSTSFDRFEINQGSRLFTPGQQ